MKISKKDTQLLFALAGILIVFFSYQFVYQALSKTSDTMKGEISELETKLAELENHKANIQKYESETTSMEQEMTQFYSQFPADIREEDRIMFAVKMQDSNDYMEISSLSLGEPQQIYAMTNEPATTEGEEGEENEVSQVPQTMNSPILYQVPLGVSMKVTYDGLKEMIEYINENQKSMSIESITVAYDNGTGILTGNTMVNMFRITGTDSIYTEPQVPSISIGTDNIFGTISMPNEDTMTGEETENEAETDTDTEAGN